MTRPFRDAIRALFVSALVACFFGVGTLALVSKSADAGESDDLSRIYEDYNRASKLYEAGKYQESIDLLSQVLQTYSAEFGQKDEHYALMVNSLATVYKSQGRYAEAEPL